MNDEDYIDDETTLADNLDDEDDDDDYYDDDDDDYDLDDNVDSEEESDEEVEEESEPEDNVSTSENERNTESYDRGFSYGQQRYNQADIDRINNREKFNFGNQGVNDNEAKPESGPGSSGKNELGDKDNGLDSSNSAADKAKEGATEKAKEGATEKAKEGAADKAKESVTDAAADKAKDVAAEKAKEAAADKAKDAVASAAAEKASSSALLLKIKIIFWAVVIIFAFLLIFGTICGITFIILDHFGLTKYIVGGDGDDSGGSSGGSTTILPDTYSPDGIYSPVGSTDTTTKDDIVIADGKPPRTFITKTYGMQSDGTMHYGIDYVTDSDPGVDNVIAVDDGKVVSVKCDCARETGGTLFGFNSDEIDVQMVAEVTPVKCDSGYGNYVKISHPNGKFTLYAHLDENSITVSEGDTVQKGQVIGKIGNTGSLYANLHFELFSDASTRVDPAKYVDLNNPRPTSYAHIKYVQGSDNKQSVCLSLLATGFSKNAVAGIMANIESESDFRTNIPGDGGTSNGICQWHNTRLTKLHNYCGDAYLSSLPCQLDFFLAELKTRSEYSYMIGNHTAYEMGHKFCYDFERPKAKETSCPGRGNKANNKYLPYVENGCGLGRDKVDQYNMEDN